LPFAVFRNPHLKWENRVLSLLLLMLRVPWNLPFLSHN
jgi:hypothetical protein